MCPTHVKFSTLSNSDTEHGTVEGEQPICLMGTGVLDLQGQCSRDLLHNTLSCTLEEEERREEKRP